MLKNYFSVAVRSFLRNKFFSAINVIGLTIGISAALVIFLIVQYDFSFDKFEKDRERIYRVVMDLKFNGDPGNSSAVPAPLSIAVQQEASGIDAVVPVMQFQGDATAKVSIANTHEGQPIVYKNQPDIVFTNAQYFQLIPFAWLAGARERALQNPFSVVLTETRAKQYFPNNPITNIVGKTITYNDEISATVTGIVKDLHEHTDFTAQEFISFASISKTNLQNQFMMNVWVDWMAYSKLYLKLSKGNTAANTEAQLKNLLKKYAPNANSDRKTMAFRLQPLSDMHFNATYMGFGQRIANKRTLYGLLAIASFILLLGCINFINLTTAQSGQRAKEIGIRKTIGSSKKQLAMQFLGEAFFITTIAMVLSIIISPLLLKIFADFIPSGLHFDLLHQPVIILFLFLLLIFVGFLSGLYPAIIMSSYRSIAVFKTSSFNNTGLNRSVWFRKLLTVSQFVIAQFFVISAFVVSKQIYFSLHKDLGFKKEAIINFEAAFERNTNHCAQLLNDIKAIPEVQMASLGFEAPAMEGMSFTNIKYIDGKKEVKENVQIRFGDSNYLPLYQIKLLAGRNVGQGDHVKELLVNETYAKDLGFEHPQDAINKQVELNAERIPIVGVMNDFNQSSLHVPIGPLIYEASNNGSIFHIALKPEKAGSGAWQSAIKKIEKAFKVYYPSSDFSYSFFDERIAGFYKAEQQTSKLLNWAMGLSILISCLGLLGLVIFTTHARTKEIGIRKVLGASVFGIVSHLSKDFIRLVVIASAIAIPLAWWACDIWLSDFEYRTALSWWIFFICAASMFLITLITMSTHTIKAAMANPVKSLRTD